MGYQKRSVTVFGIIIVLLLAAGVLLWVKNARLHARHERAAAAAPTPAGETAAQFTLTPRSSLPTTQLAEPALYVAPNGDDENPGTAAYPFQTIQAAVDRAQAGDTVYIRQGVYHEAITIKNSGEPDAPITIAAYPGERPVIDGEYTLPEGEPARWNRAVDPPIYFVWGALVRIRGSYIRLTGLEVQRSLGRAILISNSAANRNHHVVVDNCLVHDSRNSLLRVMDADDVTVENCEFYHASDYATHSRTALELNWPAAVATIDATNVILRGNLVYENWSSGISPGVDSSNITIENNIIYNHLGQQIYVHRSQGVVVRNNLVYHTNDPAFQRKGDPSSCIALNNELGFATSATVRDVTIEQNIFVGCQRNIGIWRSESSGLLIENVTIAHNTLINATSNVSSDDAAAFFIAPGNLRNIQVEHNLIVQDRGLLVDAQPGSDVTYYANAWSQSPPPFARSSADLVGGLNLAEPNNALLAGAVKPDWYKPTAASPATLIDFGANQFYAAEAPPLPQSKAQQVEPTSAVADAIAP